MGWSSRIEQALAARRDADGWRLRRRVEHNSVREITLEGRSYRHFSSNDYLGLSQHPAVIAACNSAPLATVLPTSVSVPVINQRVICSKLRTSSDN